MTDSGDGGEGGGDELPCATEGEGGVTGRTRGIGANPICHSKLSLFVFLCFFSDLFVCTVARARLRTKYCQVIF